MENYETRATEGAIEREKKPISVVYFVRHGATEYKEYQVGTPKDIDKDLSEKGEAEIEDATKVILKNINKEAPVTVLSSPRVRTRHSAEIIQKDLLSNGVHLDPTEYKKAAFIEGIRTKGDGAEIWTELGELYGPELDRLWRQNEISHPDKAETNKELFDRIKGSFEKGVRIIRKNEQSGHRNLSQIILVSHGEIIEGLIAAYSLRPFYDPERKFKTGKVAELKIYEDSVVVKYDNFEYTFNI